MVGRAPNKVGQRGTGAEQGGTGAESGGTAWVDLSRLLAIVTRQIHEISAPEIQSSLLCKINTYCNSSPDPIIFTVAF